MLFKPEHHATVLDEVETGVKPVSLWVTKAELFYSLHMTTAFAVGN
jgi:hypothetical protein